VSLQIRNEESIRINKRRTMSKNERDQTMKDRQKKKAKKIFFILYTRVFIKYVIRMTINKIERTPYFQK
jgi:cell division septal protein FtsQ